MTLPSNMRGGSRRQPVPAKLESTAANNLDLVSFERLPTGSLGTRYSSPLFALVGYLADACGPLRLHGWEYTVGPDATVVGISRAEKLTVIGRLDGSVTVAPLR